MENLGVCVLLVLDTARVLKLGELGGAFFVHLFLDDSALLAVALVDLLEDVGLVVLLDQVVSHLLFLRLLLDPSDLLVNQLLFVFDSPLFLVGMCLAGTDGLSAVLIDLLHKVDAGLVLLVPLVLA